MSLAAKARSILSEDPNVPLNWVADYYCTTPSGSKGRFTRGGSVYSLDGGLASEWAVLAALRKNHPGCDIQINNVRWSG